MPVGVEDTVGVNADVECEYPYRLPFTWHKDFSSNIFLLES